MPYVSVAETDAARSALGMWLIDLLRELLSALFSELFPSAGEKQQQRRRRRGQPTDSASGDERLPAAGEGAEEEEKEGCEPPIRPHAVVLCC